MGIKTLKTLGIELINKPPVSLMKENILDLPKMTNPVKLLAMDIMITLAGPAYISDQNVLIKLTYAMLDLSIKYGNAPASTHAYGLFGVLNVVDEKIEDGFKLGQMSLKIIDKLNFPEMKCRTLNIHNSCIRHWKEHLPEAVKDMAESVSIGLEHGDIENASYCAIHYCNNMLFSGLNLETIEKKTRNYMSLMKKTNQWYAVSYLRITLQTMLNLRNETEETGQLDSEAVSEDEFLSSLIESKSYTILQWFYTAKVVLNYLFYKYEKAVTNAAKAESFVANAAGLISVGQLNFYQSLSLLAQCKTIDFVEREAYLAQVEKNQKTLSLWANNAPQNFRHKYNIIEAERARVLDNLEAIKLYEKAITGARKNKFLHEEALSYELAAIFYLEQNMIKIAQTYMTEAHFLYKKWGAETKVAHLDFIIHHLIYTCF